MPSKYSGLPPEYRREIRNLQRRLRRAEKSGFDISNIKIPTLETIGAEDIEYIHQLRGKALRQTYIPEWTEWMKVSSFDTRSSEYSYPKQFKTTTYERYKIDRQTGELIQKETKTERYDFKDKNDIEGIKTEEIQVSDKGNFGIPEYSQEEEPELEPYPVEETSSDKEETSEDKPEFIGHIGEQEAVDDNDHTYADTYERFVPLDSDIGSYDIFRVIESMIDKLPEAKTYRSRGDRKAGRAGTVIDLSPIKNGLRNFLSERKRSASEHNNLGGLAEYLEANYDFLQNLFERIEDYKDGETSTIGAYNTVLEIFKGNFLTDEEREETEEFFDEYFSLDS